jgi:hypothetical protein
MSLTKSHQYFAQHYYITCLFCILQLHHPFWALQRRPCHCFMETVVPCSLLIIKTHQQGPFTMAIISSLSSGPTSPPSYGIKNGAWRTNISRGHNYVWWYFVSLTIELPCTQMMCFDVCMHFLTVLHTRTCTTVQDNQGPFWILCSWHPTVIRDCSTRTTRFLCTISISFPKKLREPTDFRLCPQASAIGK